MSVVFLLLLLSAVTPALAQSDCDFGFSNYARAVQLHDMGDYGRALQHYDCALLEDPDDPVIPILIDNVYEDIESAGGVWDAPRQSACEPARDHGDLGAAAFERGDINQAQIHLHCVLLVDPADVAALTLMGRIHANLGDAHSAKHYLDRAEVARAADAAQVEESESPAGFVMPDWLTPYETVPRQGASRSTGINSMAELEFAPTVKRVFVVVLTARVARPAADPAPDARDLARQASGRGDIDAAIEWMLKVTSSDGAIADDHVYLASLYDLKGDLNAAALALAAALELEPERLDLRCRLGRAYKALGDYGRAAGQFFKVIEQEIGDICGEHKRPASSRAGSPAPVERAAVSEDTTSPAQETFERGLELLSARKRYAAANTFLKALEIDPDHRDARCQLGVILTKWANYSGALAQFDQILSTDPQDECARQNRKAAILRMLTMYIPLTVDDFFFHARTYAQVEEWGLARDAFARGLERDPARTDVRCELGMVYDVLGDERSALREFDRVLTHDPSDSCAWSNREGLLQRLREGR